MTPAAASPSPSARSAGRRARRRVAAAVAATVALTAGTAAAQTSVDVVVSNDGGTRTLYVEDLFGANLTTLDFGDGRSMPFRTRVVDSTMSRDGFTVSASMTNLYRDTGSGLDWADVIGSSNLALSQPVNPLGIAGVSSQVQPLIDTVTTITDLVLCGDLGLTIISGTSCQLSVTGMVGKVQDVAATIDMSNLSNLPLLPQATETGAFTSPDYVGAAADDPNKPTSYTPTNKKVLGGLVVSDTTFLTALKSALDTVLAGLTRSQIVDDAVFAAAVQDTVGVLTDTQLSTIMSSPTVATAQALLASHVLSQTGTYTSYPVLDVTVPTDADPGTYRGTLVITGIQP